MDRTADRAADQMATRGLVLTLAALLLGAAGGPGCSIKRMVADNVGGTMEDTTRAFFSETYVRHAREAAPSLLALLDGFIVSSPENEALLASSAEMNCSFALGMAESEDPRWASRLYQKGRDYGLRALAVESDRIAAAARSGPIEDLEQVLREDFDEDQVPALFWTAMCWGSWVNVNLADMEAVADLPRAEAIMQRVLELDETYFHAGPHLFFGMSNASRPELLGGKPTVAREHFERVFALTEKKFLLAYVFYAQTYAVQTQDRALFLDTLAYVTAQPPDVAPGIELFTAIAKLRAEQLRAKTGELFVGGEPVPPTGGGDDELDDLLGE
jgi:hypothetical protein